MSERDLYDGILVGFTALSLVVAAVLLFVSAPYGRHARRGWGPSVDAASAWLIMESPTVAVFAAMFLVAPSGPGPVETVLLLLWMVHYVHRTLVFPFRLPAGAKPTPWLIVLFALFFNVTNGYLNGRWITAFAGGYPLRWFGDPRFLLGVALFAAGFALNQHSDRILLHLRKPGETGYRIPRGGAFRWVTSPNYLGELLEWSGWAIATWSSAALVFVLWTAANLVPRAISHHRWYRAKFADYPRERKAIVPGLL
jgi:protein-S-isoprenylcysteine O-methyltransferase Ste14